ncbi:MAG: hypothetical protein AAGA34_04170 [Pseudomonadota bacterium]
MHWKSAATRLAVGLASAVPGPSYGSLEGERAALLSVHEALQALEE